MRQMVITRHGAPDVLQARDGPDPVPGPGEVRIAVRAAGVNFADVLARIGLYPDAPKPPVVVGYEVSGVVAAIGAGVTTFHEGDRVIALTRFGGYADCVVVPHGFVFAMAAALGDVDAAAIPVNYLTALLALYRMANASAGDSVLIHSAGGGVGIAATQLAPARATVFGTASASKHDAIRRQGVEHAIDYRTQNVVDEVRRITSGRGVDVVLDPIGGRSFADSYRCWRRSDAWWCGASSMAPGRGRNLWHALVMLARMPTFSRWR